MPRLVAASWRCAALVTAAPPASRRRPRQVGRDRLLARCRSSTSRASPRTRSGTSTSTASSRASTARTPSSSSRPATTSAIPLDVYLRERYNHIGDITWDKREGGRVLLPLECFLPFFGNICRTGSIGVADPETLAVALLREARPGLHRQGDVGRGVAERQAAVDLERQRRRPARLRSRTDRAAQRGAGRARC